MDYREADEQLFKILKAEATDMFASIKETAYPETYRALFGFCAKTNALKTGVFDAADADNHYACRILLRCMCEHYLKFMFLWATFVKEKSDRIGAEYFAYCGAHELRDYGRALAAADKLVGHAAVVDMNETIARMYPKAVGVADGVLEAASAKFKYRAVLRFLAEEIPATVAGDWPFLARIAPAYARLSSFVHGGPWSDREMYSFDSPEATQGTMKDAAVVFTMAATTLMFTAMVVAREFPVHGIVATKVRSLVHDFNAGRTEA